METFLVNSWPPIETKRRFVGALYLSAKSGADSMVNYGRNGLPFFSIGDECTSKLAHPMPRTVGVHLSTGNQTKPFRAPFARYA
jgi:hypothetical protein